MRRCKPCDALLKSLLAVGIMAVTALGCGLDSRETYTELIDNIVGDDPQADYPADEKASHFFIERDRRKCAHPRCGGFMVWNLNQEKTKCADGKMEAKCYVVEIDWSALGLTSQQVNELEGKTGLGGRIIAKAVIKPKSFPNVGKLGVLIAEFAWTAATQQTPQGAFFSLKDLGFVCVAYPCFNIRAYTLGKTETKDVSGLNLSAVKATNEQLEAADKAKKAGTLLLSGEIKTDAATGKKTELGRTLIATQLFLPYTAK